MVSPPEPARRARSLYLTGGLGIALAVVAGFVYGLLPAGLLAVAGIGNLLAAPVVGRGEPMPVYARALILVGGLGFAVVMIVLGILTLT